MFSYLYKLKGLVVYGSQIGRTIDFPTANMNIEKSFDLELGVYVSISKIKDDYFLSITNVGYHPTINKLETPIMETYILNYSKDIYDETITVYLIKYIRSEIKLSSLDKLKQRMYLDKQFAIDNYKNFKDLPVLKNVN